MDPVWVDEHDAVCSDNFRISAGRRARRPYKKQLKGIEHEWAQLSAKSDDEDEEGMGASNHLGASAVISAKSSKALLSKHVKFKHLRDVTVGHQQQGPISAVKFHPIKPVLVTATTSGNIALFEICKENTNLELKWKDSFLQSIHLPRFRIDNFDFFAGGTSILTSSSNQNHLYTYDLLSGKVALVRQPNVLDSLRTRMARLSADGSLIGMLANSSDIFVFAFKTMEHLHTFRGGDEVVDFCFAPFDRNILYSLTVGGTVNTLNLVKCADHELFFDHGCVIATCFSCSRSGQFIACGSNTGVVNVYDLAKVGKSRSPKPARIFDQLTTSISFVRFNPDAQMLAFGSTIKRMSGRLANCSSGNLFQNFPSKQEHFASDLLTACDFSPNSAFFSFGTKQGRTRLYQLNHCDVY